MTGTFANTAAILLGSLLGSLLKKGLKPRYEQALFTAVGLAACALGVSTIAQNLPQSQYPVLFIVSLALGGLAGSALDLEQRFHRLTARFSKTNLGEGLSTAILLFCMGTLSILGPIRSALAGDHTFLFTNATLDFVTSLVLASSYGIGIAAAAGVLFCWQGAIYLGAGFLAEFLTGGVLCELSILGGILIAASGLSILKIKDCKTMNLLPCLLVPPAFFALRLLAGLG